MGKEQDNCKDINEFLTKTETQRTLQIHQHKRCIITKLLPQQLRDSKASTESTQQLRDSKASTECTQQLRDSKASIERTQQLRDSKASTESTQLRDSKASTESTCNFEVGEINMVTNKINKIALNIPYGSQAELNIG